MTIQQVETCAHLEADSTGAKVQYPDGTLGCFRCWSERPQVRKPPEDDTPDYGEGHCLDCGKPLKTPTSVRCQVCSQRHTWRMKDMLAAAR